MSLGVGGKDTYQALFQESFGKDFEFSYNVFTQSVLVLIKTEPNLTEIKFLDKTLSNLIPTCCFAQRFFSSEGRPIAIIQQELEMAPTSEPA
jgi:hypothetical protein